MIIYLYRYNKYRHLEGRGKNTTLTAGKQESEPFLYCVRHPSQVQRLAWNLAVVAFTTVKIKSLLL